MRACIRRDGAVVGAWTGQALVSLGCFGAPTLMQARAESLRSRPSSPLITDCTQGRVELSHATFDNWVCKTVNLLRLELDVEPGR